MTRPVMLLMACGLLGWTADGIVQPAIPLLILDRGGDAVLVGIVAAAFALPTLLLRPLVGHRIDRTGHGPIHRLGGAILVLAPIAFTVAPLALVPVARFVNGVGWAMYGTANNVVLARLAPASRRAEASAYFNAAFAAGFLIGPPIGLFLYATGVVSLPFLAASVAAAAAFASAALLARATRSHGAEGPYAGPAAKPGARPALHEERGPSRHAVIRQLARLFEPSAVPAMVGLMLFMTSQTLFVPFAPVYARTVGIPDEQLAIYYPAYAILLMGGQLLTGRVSDRFGRVRAIGLGVGLGIIGLAVASLGTGLATFALGGGLVAIGTTFAIPSFAAAAMDRAPAGRMGVAMATFSMGYQAAAGFGGLLWGVIIASVGYPWPFLVAMVLMLLSLGMALRYLRPRRAPQPAPVQG